MRSNFTALVTGERFSQGVSALSALGATTVFEPMDTVIDAIRLGASSRLCADVIVVDGTASAGNALRADGMLRAVALTQRLANLSDMYVMSSGVRWCAIPIVLVGNDDGLGTVVRAYPTLRKIEYVSRWGGLASRDVWTSVYERAQARYLEFGPTLAESLRSLGLVLLDERGHILRAGLRKGVRRESVVNSFYDGGTDAWFRTRSAAVRELLSPLFSSNDAVAHAVVELEVLCRDRYAKEERPERIARFNPCLMDIARFEAYPQFSFVGEDGKVVRIDMLRLSYGVEHGRPPSELLEYKRAAFRLLRHRAFASPAAEAVMQTAEYAEHVSARREALERRLGARLGTLRRTVVAGRAADADPMRLSRAREAARGVRVLGWDEVATSARRRYRVPDGWEPHSAA